MPAQNIDEVIIQLDDIIARCRREQSRLGYFAVLYRNVTLSVREGIKRGLFQDGARMERLDVTFANRYLAALESFQQGEQPTRCWLVSFQAATAWPPLILQHLLLGMNAHINYDLAIAAAETAPGDELASLKHDFYQINNLLGSMIAKVESNINELSPWIKFLDHIDPKAGDAVINFSIDKARDCSWIVATRINSLDPDRRRVDLALLDASIAALGNVIRSPRGWLFKIGLHVIRLRESNDIPHVIDVLSQM